MSNTSVPSYLECAKPNSSANRAPWYKNTAPTYAGIFLWFVFWSYSLASGTPGGKGRLHVRGSLLDAGTSGPGRW